MEKTTYADYLAMSESFNDWLKQVPFGFWNKAINTKVINKLDIKTLRKLEKILSKIK